MKWVNEMKKRKILFHINSLGRGGAEHVLSMLSGYFADDGYEVIVVTLWRAGAEYELPGNVSRINLGDFEKGNRGRLWRALKRFKDLRRIIQKEQPDLVISFCSKANFRCAFGMIGMRIPLLTSVRNNPERDYAVHRFSTWWMEKKALGCVFQTEDAKKFFHKNFQEKSRIIWNPVDEKYLTTQKTNNDGYFIATVGRIAAQKNHLLLLKAFNRIQDQFRELELRIYGEDSEKSVREALDQFVEEHRLAGRVRFMGQCSSLEKELQNAAVFVLSSDYEGMPNALAEAMVLGLPVISTDCPCGGSSMLIDDGVSGMLIPVGDEVKLAETMERLLSDKEFAAALGRNAARIADKVSPHKVYEEWKDYVEILINN